MIEYDNFQKSLKNLELQCENYLTNYQNVDVSSRDLTCGGGRRVSHPAF